MIYPKEMKKTIEELRGVGDLNEKALKYYYIELIRTYAPICFVIFIASADYFMGARDGHAGWFLIFIVICLPIMWPTIWRAYYAPYIHGEVQVGEVTSIHYTLASVHISIKNKITENKDHIELPFLAKVRYVRTGGKIEYYKSPDNKAALKQFDTMQKYCLKKSLIQENKQ